MPVAQRYGLGFDAPGQDGRHRRLRRIGRGVAQRLQRWNISLLASYPEACGPEFGVRFTDLDTLLRESDVVALHAAATPEIRHVIDACALSRMKPPSILINTSRGSLIYLDALARSLSKGQIAGAGIDVYEPEKPSGDHPIYAGNRLRKHFELNRVTIARTVERLPDGSRYPMCALHVHCVRESRGTTWHRAPPPGGGAIRNSTGRASPDGAR
jgi:hypothetical protein